MGTRYQHPRLGDADRVTVDAGGKLSVVHYDIFSGPNVVGRELRGREKLCSVYRIVWDQAQDKICSAPITAIVGMPDGTLWVSSFARGLIRIDSFGSVLDDATSKLMTSFVSALGRDPSDGSLWAGMAPERP